MSSNATGRADTPRILLVRLGAMGDVIHALPVAAMLRRALPGARLVWAVEPRWAPLLEGNPAVDRVVPVPLGRWRKSPISRATRTEFAAWRNDLRAEAFDAVLDLQGLLKSAAVAWLAGAGRTVGFDRRGAREPLATWLYSEKIAVHRRHVVDRNLALGRAAFGIRDDGPAEFWLPPGQRSPLLPEGEFLLASPFAGWPWKEWPAERYTELAALAWRERGLPLVLDGAPGDAARLAAIAARAPDGACVAHPSTLAEGIGAARAARAVVGVDSGPLHLAAALGRPGVALFGPTDPARNGPYGRTFGTLRAPGAETSYKRRAGHAPSMLALSASEVWPALRERLDVVADGPSLAS